MHIRWTFLVALALVASTADAQLTFLRYTGTLDREGNDPAGLVGATFEWNAAFELGQYVDNGYGDPSLPLLRSESTFTISDASDVRANGLYTQPSTVSMLPNDGGALVPLPSNPSQFSRTFDNGFQLRLGLNFVDMYGGDGLDVEIGDMAKLSHFPTAIESPILVASPHNSQYTIHDISISVHQPGVNNPVPEPSTIVIWGAGLALLGGATLRRRCSFTRRTQSVF